jgi:segregation and condensation protein B
MSKKKKKDREEPETNSSELVAESAGESDNMADSPDTSEESAEPEEEETEDAAEESSDSDEEADELEADEDTEEEDDFEDDFADSEELEEAAEESKEGQPVIDESEAGDEAEETVADEEVGESILPLESVVEAVLFAARGPLKLHQIARCAGRGTRREKVSEAIAALNQAYLTTGRAFEIVEVAEKYQLMSRPEYAPHLQRLFGKKKQESDKDKKLTGAALDTLSIIAYKQPITRAEVEKIRGVGCGPVMRALIERGTVKVVGKKADIIGQPLLYGTTELFLQEFGLGSLDELPMVNELRRATGTSTSIAQAQEEIASVVALVTESEEQSELPEPEEGTPEPEEIEPEEDALDEPGGAEPVTEDSEDGDLDEEYDNEEDR